MTNDDKGNALSLNPNSGVLFDIDILNNRQAAIGFFVDFLKGRKQGVTSPYEAMMVYARCRELQLPFASSIDHMAIIGGKICADIHIKTALALRASGTLWWEKVKDAELQYQYTDGTNYWTTPLKPIPFLEEAAKDDPVVATLQYVWDEASVEAAKKANKTPFYNVKGVHNQPYNLVTEYKFYRIRKDINGKDIVMTAIGKFSTLEGHIAQLGYGTKGTYEGVRDPNSNWGKYEARMVDIRAWDNGFKEIGADLGMGMPEIGEMAEVHQIPYKFDPQTGDSRVEFDFKVPADYKQTLNEGEVGYSDVEEIVDTELDSPVDEDVD